MPDEGDTGVRLAQMKNTSTAYSMGEADSIIICNYLELFFIRETLLCLHPFH